MGRTVTFDASSGSVVAGYNAGDMYRVAEHDATDKLIIDGTPTDAEVLTNLADAGGPGPPWLVVGLDSATGPLVVHLTGAALPLVGEVVVGVSLSATWTQPGPITSGYPTYGGTAQVYAAVGLGAPTDGRDPFWELSSGTANLPKNPNPAGPRLHAISTAEQPVSPSTEIAAGVHVFVQHTGGNARYLNYPRALIHLADVAVVSINAPTGTVTATSLPEVTWMPTLDSAIGGQTNYDVRIFDSATHGDPLFNVDTSIPVASSGEAVGSATSWQSTALVNDTYFAYVRVAQTTNGEQVWSAWDTTTWIQDVDGPEWSSVVAVDTGTGVEITATHDGVSPAWDRTEFERSTDGGTTWTAVGEITASPATTDPAVIVDLWYQPGASTVWRVRGWDGPAAGSWTGSNTLAALDDAANGYLTAPNGVRTTIRPTTRAFQRARRVGTHQVLGRSDPVGTSDVLGLRTGTLTLETWDAAEADALMAILEAHPVVHVALHVDLDIAPGWWQLASVGDNMTSQVADVHERLWTLQATEVAPPEGH